MRTSDGYMVSKKENKELIQEHKRIIPKLEKVGLKKEAKIQSKDLKKLKNKQFKEEEDDD